MNDAPNDKLYTNLANGLHSPFKALPHNEMMLMTDRRAQQFLMRVLTALDAKKAIQASDDSDLTPLHFWQITRDTGLQGKHYSEYERPWEYSVFPAIRQSIIDRWEECLKAHTAQGESLTGEQVANLINAVVMRRFNVTKDGLIMIESVTRGRPEFQSLRDYFSETVVPYRPTTDYSLLVYGNEWQSLIADCMHRKDIEGLKHILTEGKKLAPESLSDAIAHMVMGISGRLTIPERFDIDVIAALNICMSYMIFSKENARNAIRDVLRDRKINDKYGMYEAALDQVIKNPELQVDDLSFGYDLGNRTIPEISSLIGKLVEGGVRADYIFSRVFVSLMDCRQDVWEQLDSLLPPNLEARQRDLWTTMKTWRKTAVLEGLHSGVERGETEMIINMPLGIHHVENAHHTLTPFPLELRGKVDELKTLPDFYYLKPEPSAYPTYGDKIKRNKEEKPRTGYKFISLVQAPEKHTWMKLPNHTHYAPGAELGLVALTSDNESRFFPFDCLEQEFKAHLLAHFSVTKYEKPETK